MDYHFQSSLWASVSFFGYLICISLCVVKFCLFFSALSSVNYITDLWLSDLSRHGGDSLLVNGFVQMYNTVCSVDDGEGAFQSVSTNRGLRTS